MVFILFSLVLCSAFACWADDIVPAVVYNDLTEVFARKDTIHYPSRKPADLLYKGDSLQSELLHFNDVRYGTHIWRLTSSFNTSTFAHNHINRSPWNSNGSEVGLISSRCFPPNWCPSPGAPGDPHAFLMQTDGNNFLKLNEGNCTGCTMHGTRFRFFVWDRHNPNYAYFAGNDGLYRMDLANVGVYAKVAGFTTTTRSKVIYSYPSEQNCIWVNDDFANNYATPMTYMVDLNKPAGDPLQVVSYPISFHLTFPGHDQAKENSMHDQYFTRKSDGSYGFNYGPVAGLGEYLFWIAPFDGNSAHVRIWYENTGYQGIPYHSHPAWGSGGTLTSYFGERYPYASNKWGWQIANDSSRVHVKQLSACSGGHAAWDGYDPDFIFAAIMTGAADDTRVLLRAHVSGSENNAEPFVNPYTGLNDGADGYHTLPRPAQSPDATKLFYHSSMTARSDNFVDSYIAVARYPMSPTNVKLGSAAEAKIEWTAPAFHREIKGYHVYRSRGNLAGFIEVTSSAVTALSYADTGLASGIDYYYGITSEEWCGLEGNALSNIIKVTYNGSAYTSQDAEAAGHNYFDITSPADIPAPTVTAVHTGVNRLTWIASADGGLWYYNVYYSTEAVPTAVPQRRIASVPKGRTTYIDWQARISGTAYYKITAVDRKGNESTVTTGIPGPSFLPESGVRGFRVRSNLLCAQSTISFSLAKNGKARLNIFTMQGKCVRTLASKTLTSGDHCLVWDGRDDYRQKVAGGCYLVRLDVDDAFYAGKTVLFR